MRSRPRWRKAHHLEPPVLTRRAMPRKTLRPNNEALPFDLVLGHCVRRAVGQSIRQEQRLRHNGCHPYTYPSRRRERFCGVALPRQSGISRELAQSGQSAADPTELDFQSLDTIQVGKISYPKGESLALEF